jgi:hypothetical protein
LFVGGITGGVQDYPLQKTFVYNTYTDFVADIDAGVYGTAGNESWFQYGDLFIERDTRYQYGFLPSSTGSTAVGVWTPLYPLTVTGAPELPPGSGFVVGDSVVITQSYLATSLVPSPINDGALWFNTDTGVLYTGYLGPSGNYQWVQNDIGVGSTVGGSAVTGSNGATGAQGIQGVTGATGPQGATGSQGATGPQGVTGATGPVGDYVISVNGQTGAVQYIVDFKRGWFLS